MFDDSERYDNDGFYEEDTECSAQQPLQSQQNKHNVYKSRARKNSSDKE